jgi:hypothetical protein
MKHKLACGLAAAALVALPARAGAQDPAPKIWSPPSIYPDLSVAPTQDVADARRLWQRSKNSAKRLFPTVAATRARGYKGHVKNVNRPKPFFFHLRNTSYHHDRRELDPRRPEAVVYWYDPPRPMVLVAFMDDLRSGVARLAPRPEFATAFNRDFGDPTPDSAAGCQPSQPEAEPHHEDG